MNNTSLDALFSGLTKNEPTEKQETPPQPEPPVIKKSVEQGTAREKQKGKKSVQRVKNAFAPSFLPSC